jgi:ATP-dependent phosphoenolpyruvate carboxykinase
MIKAYEHNGQQTTNPYTRETLPANTLNRLSKLQTLNTNEANLLQGVDSILREIKFTYKNNNDLQKMRRKVANNYIQNMLELNDNMSPSQFQAVKNSLIRKGRL